MKGLVLVIAVCFVSAAAAQSGFAGATQSNSLKASLNSQQQTPPQKFKATGGSGHFTASLVRKSNGKGTLSWHLSYQKLSSPVTSAYIFIAKHGKQGQVVVGLCTKCKTTASGTLATSVVVTKALGSRTGEVTIRTKKNPKGEISGKLIRSS
jgi:hypothetical protein